MKTLAFKDEGNELPLLLGFRTLEQFSGPGSQGNQAFQRCAILCVTLLVLLDASGDLGLLFL
ncbi:MAG: hypothetical protein WAV78_15640 [Xanthobacteraceae bacterium]